jgi:hypothetical protein
MTIFNLDKERAKWSCPAFIIICEISLATVSAPMNVEAFGASPQYLL